MNPCSKLHFFNQNFSNFHYTAINYLKKPALLLPPSTSSRTHNQPCENISAQCQPKLFNNIQVLFIGKSLQIKRSNQHHITMPRTSQQNQAHPATLTFLHQLHEVSTSAKLNSEQHKLCLHKLERFLNQKGTLLRSTLTNILSEIKTCHKMDDLNQYQLNLLCSQFQSHLVTLKLVNPDFPAMFNLNFSQPRDDEVEIIEPTSSAGGRAPSSALSLSAPSTSELSPSTSQ